ncbi:MAG: Peptidoglycan-binding lysin domain protein [Myxococcales bacterium]|nr:Peptidoglycan-binding lysin domain protein [Myxococcales bacterium]
MRLAYALLLVAGVAGADTHVVQRGETLEHVALAHGCSVDVVLAANALKTTLVPAGTIVSVPACSLKARTQTRNRAKIPATPPADGDGRNRTKRRSTPSTDDDDRARAALAVIDDAAQSPKADGASWVDEPVAKVPRAAKLELPKRADDEPDDIVIPRGGRDDSVGHPWAGRLRHGEHLDEGIGYQIRTPSRAFGAAHVIEHLRLAIAEVRALYPDLHTLAIGDLSAEHGGKIADHHSHQSGLDVDVGFYFTHVPEGYPDRFAPGDDDLDLEATWALLTAFARTADLETGVEMIFLDHAVQGRLYTWAKAHGTPDDELAFLLQYPRTSNTGIVRHWPNHTDHMHVRFKSGR